MNTIANAFYNKMLGHYIRFRPCVDAEHTEEFRCHMCGSLLEYAYMEQRLYAVRCPYCSMVTLVKIDEIRRMVRQTEMKIDAFLIGKARAKGRGRLAHLCKYAKKGRSRKRNGKRAVKGMHIAKLAGEPKLIYSDDDGWKDVLEW